MSPKAELIEKVIEVVYPNESPEFKAWIRSREDDVMGLFDILKSQYKLMNLKSSDSEPS